MKKIPSAFLILSAALILGACSSPSNSHTSPSTAEAKDITETTDKTQTSQSPAGEILKKPVANETVETTASSLESQSGPQSLNQPSADPAPSATPSPSQTIGTDQFGHISIPDTWVEFLEMDGGDDMQYSDPAGNSIITLNIISTEGLTAQQASQLTAEMAAQSVWYNLEQNQVENISGAKVKLGNYDAFQVYGTFTSEDNKLDSMIVAWIFEDEDGIFHYISAEAPYESIMDVTAYVEGSYTLH